MDIQLETKVLLSGSKPISKSHKLELKTTRLKYWNSKRRYQH